jgi:L-aspartate oxidase
MSGGSDIIHVASSRPVVVGSGVAGLTAALGLGDCIVITKTELAEGSSRLAQGGIAAALGADDDPSLHAADTVAVSGGLGDRLVAELVTRSAPERIAWLQSLGAQFDHADGTISLGREAGHGRNRIVHADGDSTGAEVMRALRRAVIERPEIEVWEHTLALDLIRRGTRVVGILVRDQAGQLTAISSPTVILATGGIGRVYSRTTNPVEVTGDGFAMAARAGAQLFDPEFVQFHPTALDSPLDPMPLLTEALRGAGAVLVDGNGTRFMLSEHPDAELAPRDVVARANWSRRNDGGDVYLDATHLGATFPDRFPTVFASALEAGIDPRFELLPASPAAHYHMGGIAVDANGRSSLPGLYAVGETAATKLHGANRLASNSLLEGLVFGARVADDARRQPDITSPHAPLTVPVSALFVEPDDDAEAVSRLRTVMWDAVGVARNATGLAQASETLQRLGSRLETGPIGRNLGLVAGVIIDAATARIESRGGHFRSDYPHPNPTWARHTTVDPTPSPVTVIGAAERVVA